MKVLLDRCIAANAAEAVGQSDHDVMWARDWPKDPGDEEILRVAAAEGRVLVTIDKDFGELVIVKGVLHSGLIRLGVFALPNRRRRCFGSFQVTRQNSPQERC